MTLAVDDLAKSRKIHVGGAYLPAEKHGGEYADRKPGSECELRASAPRLDYDTRDRRKYHADEQRRDHTLPAEEQPRRSHKIDVAQTDSPAFRYEPYQQERHACGEQSYHHRHDIKTALEGTEDVLGYRQNAYEDHNGRGDKLGVPVHEEYYQQSGVYKTAEYRVDSGLETVDQSVSQRDQEPAHGIHRFDYRVAGRDRRTAGTALSAQHTPAHYRDKVALQYGSAAGHAVGV